MRNIGEYGVEIMGGQIMSRVSGKNLPEDEKMLVKVAVPKSVTSEGAVDTSEMPQEEVCLKLDSRKMTEKGDIVIKLSTPYGAGMVDDESAGCIVPSFCAIIKSTGDLYGNYLLAFLNSDYCKRQIIAQVSGGVMTVISVGKIKNLLIPDVEYEKQVEIGDNYIETKRRLQVMRKIAALEEEKNNIIFEELANE